MGILGQDALPSIVISRMSGTKVDGSGQELIERSYQMRAVPFFKETEKKLKKNKTITSFSCNLGPNRSVNWSGDQVTIWFDGTQLQQETVLKDSEFIMKLLGGWQELEYSVNRIADQMVKVSLI